MPRPVLPRAIGRMLTAATVVTSGSRCRFDMISVVIWFDPRFAVGSRDADRRHHPVLGLKAAIGGEHADQAPHEQACTDEQHDRQRDFRGHEGGAQPALTAVGRGPAQPVLQNADHVRARRPHHRDDARDDADGNGNGGGKREAQSR